MTRPASATRCTKRRAGDLNGPSPQTEEAVFAARPRSRWNGVGLGHPQAALPAGDIAGHDEVEGFAGVARKSLPKVSDSPQATSGRPARVALVALAATITELSAT